MADTTQHTKEIYQLLAANGLYAEAGDLIEAELDYTKSGEALLTATKKAMIALQKAAE
jgi:hypothetical protein